LVIFSPIKFYAGVTSISIDFFYWFNNPISSIVFEIKTPNFNSQ